MKKLQLVLLATLGFGLAGSSLSRAAIYNGDLLVGFTKQSGNDLIYDLGAESSLTNGKSWNLSTLLSGFNLTTVQWGVIGDASTPSPRPVWTTTSGFTPGLVANNAGWSAKSDTPCKSIYQFFSAAGAGQSLSIAASDDNSWNGQTISGSSPTLYHNAYEIPNVTGLTSDSFWQVLANNSAPTQLGTFTLSAGGILTFNIISAGTPPAPQIVKITRAGNLSTIFFTTTNGATYSLYFTNSGGLTAPIANWPVSATTLTGDGLTNSLSDTTTDSGRFYRVGAH